MNMELYGSSNAKDTSRDLYDEQGEIRSRNFLPTHGKDIQEINRKRNQEHNKIHIQHNERSTKEIHGVSNKYNPTWHKSPNS